MQAYNIALLNLLRSAGTPRLLLSSAFLSARSMKHVVQPCLGLLPQCRPAGGLRLVRASWLQKDPVVCAGAVVQSLTNSSLTPLTILAFTLLPLPYLDRPAQLSPQLAVGSAILVLGLLTYNSKKYLPWLQTRLGKQD